MAGAFVAYVLVVSRRAFHSSSAALLGSLLFSLGRAVYFGLIRPIMAGPHLALAMMAVAIGYILRGVARNVWGREVLPFPKGATARFVLGRHCHLPRATWSSPAASSSPCARIGAGVLRDADRQDGAGCISIRTWRGIGRASTLRPSREQCGGSALRMGALAGILIAPDHAALPGPRSRDPDPRLCSHDAGRLRLFLGAAVGGLILGVGELWSAPISVQADRDHRLSHHHRCSANPAVRPVRPADLGPRLEHASA